MQRQVGCKPLSQSCYYSASSSNSNVWTATYAYCCAVVALISAATVVMSLLPCVAALKPPSRVANVTFDVTHDFHDDSFIAAVKNFTQCNSTAIIHTSTNSSTLNGTIVVIHFFRPTDCESGIGLLRSLTSSDVTSLFNASSIVFEYGSTSLSLSPSTISLSVRQGLSDSDPTSSPTLSSSAPMTATPPLASATTSLSATQSSSDSVSASTSGSTSVTETASQTSQTTTFSNTMRVQQTRSARITLSSSKVLPLSPSPNESQSASKVAIGIVIGLLAVILCGALYCCCCRGRKPKSDFSNIITKANDQEMRATEETAASRGGAPVDIRNTHSRLDRYAEAPIIGAAPTNAFGAPAVAQPQREVAAVVQSPSNHHQAAATHQPSVSLFRDETVHANRGEAVDQTESPAAAAATAHLSAVHVTNPRDDPWKDLWA